MIFEVYTNTQETRSFSGFGEVGQGFLRYVSRQLQLTVNCSIYVVWRLLGVWIIEYDVWIWEVAWGGGGLRPYGGGGVTLLGSGDGIMEARFHSLVLLTVIISG